MKAWIDILAGFPVRILSEKIGTRPTTFAIFEKKMSNLSIPCTITYTLPAPKDK